jgi:anti-sigma factor RsiW
MRSNVHPVEPEELMAYLDGELPVDRASATAAHLQECRECQILAAEMKSLSEGLTAWEIATPEPVINADLTKALEEREEKQAALVGRWGWFRENRFRRAVPWASGALVGGLAVLLVTFTLISTFTRREHEPGMMAERTETAARPGVQLSMPTAIRTPSGAAGGDRDKLQVLSPSQLSESQRQELLKRKELSLLASNLEVNGRAGVEDQLAAKQTAGPLIIRTAQLTVVIQNLDTARAQVDKIVQRYSGYIGDLTVSAPSGGARTLTATLRVPATQLDAALVELKKLGRVDSESQNGQDVTSQYVDLEARLSNSRNTEKRLLELLSQRTGKLSDVLEVETELSRVREEIERMEGERRMMAKQVEYATLTATVSEEYKTPASALPDSLGTRLRNAAVGGYQSVVNFFIDVALLLMSDGPMLLVWIAILFFPVRWAWRKLRTYRETPSL